MKYCKDCIYWKPDFSKVSNKGLVMYGNCQHPDCKTSGSFHDHRQNRDGSGRIDWTARHTNSRYRCNKACETRFKSIRENI